MAFLFVLYWNSLIPRRSFKSIVICNTVATGSFPGVKRPGRGVDRPPLSSAEVKERVELCLYSLFGPSWPVLGWTLPFTYTIGTVAFWPFFWVDTSVLWCLYFCRWRKYVRLHHRYQPFRLHSVTITRLCNALCRREILESYLLIAVDEHNPST
jgi:hypothetical protein